MASLDDSKKLLIVNVMEKVKQCMPTLFSEIRARCKNGQSPLSEKMEADMSALHVKLNNVQLQKYKCAVLIDDYMHSFVQWSFDNVPIKDIMHIKAPSSSKRTSINALSLLQCVPDIRSVIGSFTMMKAEDVLFCDNDICILNPLSPRGVLIRSQIPIEKKESVWKNGLMSNKHRMDIGLDTDTSLPWECSFFRAPYAKANTGDIPTEKSINEYNKEQIKALYEEHDDDSSDEEDDDDSSDEEDNIDSSNQENSEFVYIRVDPKQSRVFASEFNYLVCTKQHPDFQSATSTDKEEVAFIESKKYSCSCESIIEYMDIIEDNKVKAKTLCKELFRDMEADQPHRCFAWDLHSFKPRLLPPPAAKRFPYNPHNIAYNSELQVHMPVIPPEWFVIFD